jgi:hypothetical protein
LLFTTPHDVALRIEAYVSGPEDRIGLLLLPRPPRERVDAGEQFGYGKGSGQAVVRPCVEAGRTRASLQVRRSSSSTIRIRIIVATPSPPLL